MSYVVYPELTDARRRETIHVDAPPGHSTEQQADPAPLLAAANLSNLALLSRVLGFAKPYLATIALCIALTAVFSAGRYARAYLMKPLLDDVLLPAHAAVTEGEAVSWSSVDISLSAPESVRERPGVEIHDQPRPMDKVLDNLRFVVLAALSIALVVPFVLFARLYLLSHTLYSLYIHSRTCCCNWCSNPGPP